MKQRIRLEICIDAVEGGLAAQEGGADRVELCDNLAEGGTTPSAGMIRVVRERMGIPLFVMIRPRGGDFVYSDFEFEVMKRDLATARELGAHGAVFGLLLPDGSVDVRRVAELTSLARPMAVTFHRAFDMVRDPLEGLENLIRLGVDRILTSGMEATALEGAEMLRDLVERADDRIVVMAGGGIREENVREIVSRTGVCEVHASGGAPVESAMTYRNNRVFMGRAPTASEYARRTTDPDRVRALVRELDR